MKYEAKRRRRKRRTSPIIVFLDIIVLLATLACFIYGVYHISKMGLFPMLYIVLIGCIVVVFVLLSCILMLLKQPIWTRLLKMIISVALGIGVVYGANSINFVNESIDEILKTPESYDEYVTIVARKDSGFTSVEQLKDKRIAVQRSIDTEHMKIAMEELSKYGMNDVKNFFFYEDYNSAIKNLNDGWISAMVISENYREIIEENYPDFSKETSRIDAYVVTIPVNQIEKKIDVVNNSFTVMVSGIDTLGKPTLRENSDSNLLVTVNPLTKTITMVSIPRDTLMPNACLYDKDDKLTHTGRLGIDCTIKTLENYFDITIDYYARISFSSVIDVVNTLGGIEVDVPMDFCERPANRSYQTKDIIYVKKGKQTLNGEQALALARHRKTVKKGDVGRAQNQQLVVNAIIKKAIQPSSFGKIDDLVQVIGNTVQTNFSKNEIYSFVNSYIENPTSWTMSNNVIAGKTSTAYTATVPGIELSVIKLSDEEINRVKYIIHNAQSMDLSDLSFTINNMTVASEVVNEGETSGASGGDYCHLLNK